MRVFETKTECGKIEEDSRPELCIKLHKPEHRPAGKTLSITRKDVEESCC